MANSIDTSNLSAGDRLICALDTADIKEAKSIIDELDGVVSFFKVGLTLHLASGHEVVKPLIDAGKKVFLDLKYYDIPKTVEMAVRVAAGLGVTFITVHGNREVVEYAVKGRGDSGLQVLMVTVLTSLDQDDLREMGYDVKLEDLVLAKARIAQEAGASGVISSPREAGLIKKETKGQLLVVSPGIRDSDGSGDDQKRTMNAEEAIVAGADFLVVGRPITGKPDRRKAAMEHIEAIQRGLDRVKQESCN